MSSVSASHVGGQRAEGLLDRGHLALAVLPRRQHRQEHVVAALGQVAPARRPLVEHGDRVPVDPVQVLAEVAQQLEAPRVAPDSTRARMSVPVGAFASKSRPITAVNWSSVSSTEKSSSPRKLAGNTRRPCRLTTNGFTLLPPGRSCAPPASCLVRSCGGDPVRDLGHTCCRTRNAPVMPLAGSDWRGFSPAGFGDQFRLLAKLD